MVEPRPESSPVRGLVAATLNVLALAPAFLVSGARGSLHGWCFIALVSAFAFVEAATARGLDVSSGRASRGPLATGIALLVLLVTALVTAADAVSMVALSLGTIAMAGGIALRRAAMVALGASFVSEPRPFAPSDLVCDGPYAWLRHPSEVGLLALAGGATIVLGSGVAALLGAVTLLPIVLFRMRAETRALALRLPGFSPITASRIGRWASARRTGCGTPPCARAPR